MLSTKLISVCSRSFNLHPLGEIVKSISLRIQKLFQIILKNIRRIQVLLSPEWIYTVNINAEKINNSPEFDPNKLFQKE
jgi:hypothetical protein